MKYLKKFNESIEVKNSLQSASHENPIIQVRIPGIKFPKATELPSIVIPWHQSQNEGLKGTIASGLAGLSMLATSCDDMSPVRNQRNNRCQCQQQEVKQTEVSQIKKISDIEKEGKRPIYILKLELSQSHLSLSIGQHISDAMNSIEIELPVDIDFYNEHEIGSTIVEDFRMGSLIMKGSFGDWEIKVVDKRIDSN